MSWRDHDSADDPMRGMGRPGGDWGGLRPTFDNPMSWSIGIGRYAGITVRVHLFFLLFVLTELGRSLVPAREDEMPVDLHILAMYMASLFIVVLLHEFGHCFACRRVRGEANEILMWPLGGLAYCAPPQHWKAHLVTVLGGPSVNVIILFVTAPLLVVLTNEWLGVLLPNPFNANPGFIYLDPRLSVRAIWTLHYISWLLLLFNLLPIFPLDGGRLVQAVLWKSAGYTASMRIAVYTGYIGAILLGIVGVVAGELLLLLIAVMGGITCYMTLKQVNFTNEFLGYEDASEFSLDPSAAVPEEDDGPKPSRRERRAQKRLEREQQESERDDEAMDGILQKISRSGIESLDAQERKILERVTRRKRGET